MGHQSRFLSYLLARCPKCLEGPAFRALYSMHENCPACGLKFEREPGYFAGAMPLSYAIGFLLTLPQVLLMIFMHTRVFWMIALPTAELFLLSPLVFRYARLTWLYLDRNLEK